MSVGEACAQLAADFRYNAPAYAAASGGVRMMGIMVGFRSRIVEKAASKCGREWQMISPRFGIDYLGF